MLEQVLDINQLPLSSLEEMRQIRLTCFSPMQQHERRPTAREDKFMQPLTAERKAEEFKKYQVNNRSITNNDHNFSQKMKHSFNSDGVLNCEDLSNRPSCNSDNSFLNSTQDEEVSRVDSEELFPFLHSVNSTDEVNSHELDYNVLGLATNRSGSFIGKEKTNTDCKTNTPSHRQVTPSHRQYTPSHKQVTPSHKQLRNAAKILSDRTMEELKSVLGDDGMQHVLVKIAVELQLINVRTTSPCINEVSESETDISMQSEAQSGQLNRSPSVDNSEMRTELPPRQPTFRFQENMLSFHGMPSPFTQNLQQLKGEKNMEMLPRNYSQVTVPLFTRSTFSADEIYKQAYETNYHRDQNYYGHTSSGHLNQPWQDRQEHLNPSDDSSRFPKRPLSFNAASTIPQNFSNPLYHQDPLLHQSTTNNLQTLDSSFKNVVTSASPGNPSSSCIPHCRSQPLPKYTSSNAQLLRQIHPNLNKLPAYNTPSSPPGSSACLQPAPSTNKYYSASNATTFGDPISAYGIPLHLLLPAQHAGVIRPQLQPHPPASQRRDGIFQPGNSAQVTSYPVSTFDQQIQATLPPVVPPGRHTKDESPDSSRYRHVHSGNTYLDPQQPPQEDGARTCNQWRYFSLLQVNNTIQPDPEPPVSSSHVPHDDLFDRSDIAESGGTDLMETTNSNVGGVTQRLNDLDINLDQLKHLRFHDTNGGQALALAGFEGFPKGIRCCPECKSSNKAYMNWCTGCGELLMGIEPTYALEKIRHGGSDERRVKSLEKVIDERNLMFADKMEDAECVKEEEDDESLESGRGLSASGPPAEHDLEQGSSREPPNSGRKSSDIFKEEDLIPKTKEVGEDKGLSDEGRKQNDCRNVKDGCDDTEIEFLIEKVNDPILRGIISSYIRRKLLEKASQEVGYEFEKIDMISATVDESIANLGVTESLKSNADKDNKLRNFQELKTAHHQPVHVSNLEEVSSFENKVEMMDRGVLHSHFKYQTDNSLEKGGRKIKKQEIDSRNKELVVEISKAKEKKKITGEALMDVKIFGDDTRKSSHSVSKVIVPSLNLIRSSDEDDEVVEDETVDNEGSEMAICAASQINPDKMKNRAPNLPDEDCQNSITSKAPKKKPMKRFCASPPKPSLSQSEVPVYPRYRADANCSVPYQRHWARSSISWSTFKPCELSTRSSLTNFFPRNGPQRGVGSTPVLAPISHQSGSHLEAAMDIDLPGAKIDKRPSSADVRHRQAARGSSQRPSSASAPSRSNGLPVHPPAEPHRRGFPRAILNRPSAVTSGAQRDTTSEIKSRPASQTSHERPHGSSSTAARTSEAVVQPGPTAGREPTNQNDSPRLLCGKLHRLPHEEVYTDHLHVVAKNAYERLHEMTPRIAEGVLSLWHCLPDEIWLFIFNFLSHGDLKNVMLVSKYLHRLANDETLWKYVTVKPRYAMTDVSLAAIAHHQPLSLAMVKCQGHSLSLDGLLYFFKETQGRLQELNICGCSQGSLVGSVVLLAAARYCQQLTHLDASFCQLNDESFIAVSNSAERLESVCVNGFQSMNDDALLALLKKHGKSLRTLELYACFSLNSFAFHSIGEYCTDLRRLCLGSCNKLTDSAMINLSMYLGKIQELDLRGCKNLWNDCIRKIVRNCPCIHTLVLANCHQISDAALVEIATHLKSTLRVLDVCGCNRISDNGVVSLAKNCNQLTSLDISSTRCTSISVQQLTNNACNKWLETVKLSFLSGLTEACLLALIRHCPRLKSIHVFGCSSLKSLAKLQTANPILSVEGDTDVSR